jgi:hypothetical protein
MGTAASISSGRVSVQGGKSVRTIMSFICGMLDVPTAMSVGSVGQGSMLEGVNATQAFE